MFECIEDIRRVLAKFNAIEAAAMVQYLTYLQDVLMGLVNLHCVASDINAQGKSVGDSELGEGCFAFIKELNVRQAALRRLVGPKETKRLDILSLEKSILDLVQSMRTKFDVYWPELWA